MGKSETIHIANPIYDVVFRYLMEDNQVARLVLTHDATIIQTAHLEGHRRTELEQMLSIFDQTNRIDSEGHILALNEADYPEAYQPVIRRLQRALANPKIERTMDLEDEVLGEFQRKDKQLAEAAEQIAAAEKRIEEEKKRTEEEKNRAEEERKRAEEEKTEAKIRYQRFVKHLESEGHSLDQIVAISGLEESPVREMLGME